MTHVAKRAAFVTVALFGLSACEEGFNLGNGASTSADSAEARLAAPESGVRDIERPDLFSTTETALWDGRPSLGGIWAAHPDVTDPERVIITNETNGQRIAGALFRRERDNPGPRIQLSSDAASALTILAGQPTEVSIVVVRQEEFEIEEEAPVISDEVVGEGGEATEATEDANGGIGVAAAAAAAGTAAADEKPRGNFFQRLFGGNRRTAEPESAPLDATADSAAAPEIETQTLDPVTTSAAAAIARAEADDKPAPRPERTASIESAPAPTEPDKPASPSGLRNPFVQVGLFTVEANAFSAQDNLRSAGIVPSVLQGTRDDGTSFWRVIVGPVTTADDQAELLAQVRNLGFRDAFLTSQ